MIVKNHQSKVLLTLLVLTGCLNGDDVINPSILSNMKPLKELPLAHQSGPNKSQRAKQHQISINASVQPANDFPMVVLRFLNTGDEVVPTPCSESNIALMFTNSKGLPIEIPTFALHCPTGLDKGQKKKVDPNAGLLTVHEVIEGKVARGKLPSGEMKLHPKVGRDIAIKIGPRIKERVVAALADLKDDEKSVKIQALVTMPSSDDPESCRMFLSEQFEVKIPSSR